MKKALAIILVSVMILTMGVAVFADQIQPRGNSCGNCGGATIYDYRLFIEDPCSRCKQNGCGKLHWGWECTSCGEFDKGPFMAYACE